MNCRYCDQELSDTDKVTTYSYWQAVKFDCHKGCKVQGEKDEAFECQCLDASCNDCKHFKREKEVGGIPKGWLGDCLKFGEKVVAIPKHCMAMPCFEHRRA